MSIDYRHSGLAFPKGPPRVLDRREKKASLEQRDRAERATCHQRSGMRCEIVINGQRCKGRVTENHHILSGVGRRNYGESLLAKWRVDVCQRCHQDIGARLLDVQGPFERLQCQRKAA